MLWRRPRPGVRPRPATKSRDRAQLSHIPGSVSVHWSLVQAACYSQPRCTVFTMLEGGRPRCELWAECGAGGGQCSDCLTGPVLSCTPAPRCSRLCRSSPGSPSARCRPASPAASSSARQPAMSAPTPSTQARPRSANDNMNVTLWMFLLQMIIKTMNTRMTISRTTPMLRTKRTLQWMTDYWTRCSLMVEPRPGLEVNLASKTAPPARPW